MMDIVVIAKGDVLEPFYALHLSSLRYDLQGTTQEVIVTNKRTVLRILLASGFLVASASFFYTSYTLSAPINNYSAELSNPIHTMWTPEEIQAHLLSLQRLQTLEITTGLFCLICGGMVILIKPTLPRIASTLTLLAIAFSLTQPVFATEWNNYYIPYIQTPAHVNIAVPPLDPVWRYYTWAVALISTPRCSVIVTGGFVSYFVAIGDPYNEDFIEVGTTQNQTGIYLYSSEKVAGVYDIHYFGQVPANEAHIFKVWTSWGEYCDAYIDGNLVNNIHWSNWKADHDAFIYRAEGESTDANNIMGVTIQYLREGYWTMYNPPIRSIGGTLDDFQIQQDVEHPWLPQWSTLHQDPPYGVSVISWSPCWVHLSGGIVQPEHGGTDDRMQSNGGATGIGPTRTR